MVVAMIAVWVVQPPIHDIVDVAAVGNGFMTAARPVRVAFATDIRRALRGIGPAYTEHVFIDVIAMHVMQVPIVKVIDVTIMANCRVSAVRAVLVVMISVVRQITCGHELLPFTRLPSHWRARSMA